MNTIKSTNTLFFHSYIYENTTTTTSVITVKSPLNLILLSVLPLFPVHSTTSTNTPFTYIEFTFTSSFSHKCVQLIGCLC